MHSPAFLKSRLSVETGNMPHQVDISQIEIIQSCNGPRGFADALLPFACLHALVVSGC
jgi:hypothetical protein